MPPQPRHSSRKTPPMMPRIMRTGEPRFFFGAALDLGGEGEAVSSSSSSSCNGGGAAFLPAGEVGGRGGGLGPALTLDLGGGDFGPGLAAGRGGASSPAAGGFGGAGGALTRKACWHWPQRACLPNSASDTLLRFPHEGHLTI